MIVARRISSGSFWAEGGLSGCDPMAAISPQCSDTCMLVFQLASVTNYAQLLKLCLEIMVQDDIEY